jgi:regulator of protease activity HflC (stomatin/prohibitin superfamily)
MQNLSPFVRNTIIGSVLIIFVAIYLWPIYIVEPGNVGVVIHFGAVQPGVLPEGLHFVVPFRTKVQQMNVRVQKIQGEGTASSKDLQNVTSVVAINFYVNREKADVVFKEIGLGYTETIIEPAVQESIKAASAKYTAEELITRREDVKMNVYQEIRERLSKHNIVVTDFSIVEFKFSEKFEQAIEEKQIAEQSALRARNDLIRIQTEAEQAKAKADGEALAEIARAKAQAEAQRMLQQTITPQLLQLRAIERWNGTMPVVMGSNAGNFIDLSAIMKQK